MQHSRSPGWSGVECVSQKVFSCNVAMGIPMGFEIMVIISLYHKRDEQFFNMTSSSNFHVVYPMFVSNKQTIVTKK